MSNKSLRKILFFWVFATVLVVLTVGVASAELVNSTEAVYVTAFADESTPNNDRYNFSVEVRSRDSNRNIRAYILVNFTNAGVDVGDLDEAFLNLKVLLASEIIGDIDFYYCGGDSFVSPFTWNNQDSQVNNCDASPFTSVAVDTFVEGERYSFDLSEVAVDQVFTIKMVRNPESAIVGNVRTRFAGTSSVEDDLPFISYVSSNNFTIRADDAYSSNPIDMFNVTLTPEFGVPTTYTTSDGVVVTDVLRNDSGLWTVEVFSEDYFSETFVNLNVSEILQANLTPWTEIFAEAIANGTPIQNFTVNLDGVDYSTSSGSAFIPLFDTTADVTVNASGFALRTESLTASPFLQNATFELYTMNSFDIEFRNESTNTILDNETVFIQFISDVFAFNTSTSNGTLFVDLLTPGQYEIIYWVDPNVPRSYFTDLTPQSFQELVLYTIDEDISAFYVARAVDQGGNACQQNTVSLLRYYVSENRYVTVSMARTDAQGQAVLRVRPNIVDYKLLFTGSCGSYETPPTKFIDTSNTYTILGAQNVLTSFNEVPGIASGITYVNATRTFSYSWTSDSNIISGGCLSVTRRFNGVRTEIFNGCNPGNTGSVIYTVPPELINESVFFAQGVINTNTEFSSYATDVLEVSFVSGLFQIAAVAPFLALIVFVAMVLFFGTSGPALIVGAVVSLMLVSTFLFISLSWGVLSTLIILGGIILYRLRTS